MTSIFAVNFDWSIESCDKAPRDLNYERNTEKYGRAMKLAIDYLICNLEGLLSVNTFYVHEYSPLFSDVHCAISFNINVSQNSSHNSPLQVVHKKWEPTIKDYFINNINQIWLTN